MSIQVEHQFKEQQQWDWPLQRDDGIVRVLNDQEKFEVSLEAKAFTPKEISVKVMGNCVNVHFEHSPRKDDFGDIARTVMRTYKLPEDVDPATVKSTLTAHGNLVITASKRR